MRRSRSRAMSLMTSVLSVAAVMAIASGTSSFIATAGAKTPPKKKHTTANTLSGTWSGVYGGAFHGTFILRWTQSKSSLNGTIKLSNPSSTLTVHGSLHGSAISFGTVGGPGITYTGSVSQNKSMSGSYQTPNGGGSWSAKKT
jgi:hypothetical protein